MQFESARPFPFGAPRLRGSRGRYVITSFSYLTARRRERTCLARRATESGAKSVSVAKFRNPDAPEQTWTGRGRKPNWLVEKLKKRGVTMDDFAI
jgi:DNA-binding protein H-NS